jgi:hypothetical protein
MVIFAFDFFFLITASFSVCTPTRFRMQARSGPHKAEVAAQAGRNFHLVSAHVFLFSTVQ